MKKINVTVEVGKHNHSAFIELLPGCTATGNTLAEIKKNMSEAIAIHLNFMRKDGDSIPKEFREKYELVFQIDLESFLALYKGIISQSALARITGINESLMRQYFSGNKKPRQAQIQKIEEGIHRLGEELISVHL